MYPHIRHYATDFCKQEWNSSAPVAALHQFSHRVPTFDPGPTAASHEGLVVSTPAQQPVLEWHRGESRPHGEGDQASGGERWWAIFKNQTSFRRIHHNETHFGWHVANCAGPRSQCGRQVPPLNFSEVGRHTGFLKEDVSWHWHHFLSWTISCERCVFVIMCERALCIRTSSRWLVLAFYAKGDLRADSRREATHRRPQPGQEGSCAANTSAITVSV